MPKRGKKGVDQRVKGNVKVRQSSRLYMHVQIVYEERVLAVSVASPCIQAASSGRMADLLGDELTPGFIGFEAVSRGMGEKEGEVNGVSEEVSHSSGAKFQVVMKQLGKRDATTKIKVTTYSVFVCLFPHLTFFSLKDSPFNCSYSQYIPYSTILCATQCSVCVLLSLPDFLPQCVHLSLCCRHCTSSLLCVTRSLLRQS